MFKLHCGDDFLLSGPTYMCILYIETENACFPSDDWTDFPQTVLDWWIKELKSVWIGPERRTYVFRFMDGPYSVHCNKERDQLRLSYYRDDTKVLPDSLTRMEEMKSGIQSALETLLRRLYLEGHEECISAVAGMIKDLQVVGFR